MSPALPARVVAVPLALVLGAALATAAVRQAEDEPATPPAATPPAAATPTAVTAPPASEPAAVPPATRAALEARLLPPATSRAVQLPDDENGLGLLTAEGVLALAGGAPQDRDAGVRELEGLGFEAALARGWTAGGSTQLQVVQRFSTLEGAAAAVAAQGLRLPGPSFDTDAAPGAVAHTARRGELFEQTASFAQGPYAYRLTYLTPEEDEDHVLFERILARVSGHAAGLDP